MGKFLIFCRIQLKFRFLLYKKRWHTSWKFQLEIKTNKKVIAKKPLTNLYEMWTVVTKTLAHIDSHVFDIMKSLSHLDRSFEVRSVNDQSNLLFISYKFVKGFLAITFLLLLISSWNFHNVCQRFLYNQEQNFSWIRQKMINFPIDPHYKNRSLL